MKHMALLALLALPGCAATQTLDGYAPPAYRPEARAVRAPEIDTRTGLESVTLLVLIFIIADGRKRP